MKAHRITVKTAACTLVALLLGLSAASTTAAAASETTVEVLTAIVVLDRNAGPAVLLSSGDTFVPSNLGGLLRSGQISLGDEVVVRVITHSKDKGRHKHHGHVTILK